MDIHSLLASAKEASFNPGIQDEALVNETLRLTADEIETQTDVLLAANRSDLPTPTGVPNRLMTAARDEEGNLWIWIDGGGDPAGRR